MTAENGTAAYMITNSNTVPQLGVCPGQTPPGSVTANGGVVSTFTGSSNGNLDGTGTAAQFSYPQDIASDTSGVLYVVNQGSYRIRKVQ